MAISKRLAVAISGAAFAGAAALTMGAATPLKRGHNERPGDRPASRQPRRVGMGLRLGLLRRLRLGLLGLVLTV